MVLTDSQKQYLKQLTRLTTRCGGYGVECPFGADPQDFDPANQALINHLAQINRYFDQEWQHHATERGFPMPIFTGLTLPENVATKDWLQMRMILKNIPLKPADGYAAALWKVDSGHQFWWVADQHTYRPVTNWYIYRMVDTLKTLGRPHGIFRSRGSAHQ